MCWDCLGLGSRWRLTRWESCDYCRGTGYTVETRGALARDPLTLPGILCDLSRDTDPWVLEGVAGNPGAPSKAREFAAQRLGD